MAPHCPPAGERALVPVALLFMLLAPGCGESGSEAEREEASSAAAPAAEPRMPLFEPRQPFVPDYVPRYAKDLDPAVAGWESEVRHDAAMPRLAALVEALLSKGGAPAEALESLLAPDFSAGAVLRPEERERLLDDGWIHVEVAGTSAALPRAELAAAGAALRAAHGGAAAIDARLEATGYEERPEGGFELAVRVQLSSREGERRVQQNLRWRVGFASDPGGPRVLELRQEAFEEAVAATPVFEERTLDVLGELPFLEEEILLGVEDYYRTRDRAAGNSFLGSQGLAFGDLDGDGLEDIYLCMQGGMPNRLLRHLPGGRVADVSHRAQRSYALLDNTRSALIVDLDGDGWRDLVLAVGKDVVIAFGEGGGELGPLTVLPGPGTEEIFSLSAADPDRDGDLDLYACRYVAAGLMGGVPLPYHDATNGASNLYWRNEGKRRFVDATAQVGLETDNSRFSLAAVWADFDLDGDPDLYVTNDFGRNSFYRNDRGVFRELAMSLGLDDMAAGMGATLADYDRDGDLDIYVSNMYAAAGLRIAGQSERFMGGEQRELHPAYVRHARGNTLLANDGTGRFRDVTEEAGVGRGGWAWGAVFLDLNDDGLEDLYVPNGFVTWPEHLGETTSFYWRHVTARSPASPTPKDEYREAWHTIENLVMQQGYDWSGRERNVVYLNVGGGRFVDVSACTDADFDDDSRAAVVCDWDGDGRADLLLKNRTAPRLRVLRNRLAHPARSLALELAGTRCHPEAIGARVTVEVGGTRSTRTLLAGEGFLAQGSRRMRFGLGPAERASRVELRWPDGALEVFENLPAGSWRIVQGSGAPEPLALPPARALTAGPARAAVADEGGVRRIPLVASIPLGAIELPGLEAPERRVGDLAGAPLLVVLWSARSRASIAMLDELSAGSAELARAGLRLALASVDGPRERAAARELLADRGLLEAGGHADRRFLQALETVAIEVVGRGDLFEVPSALLLDQAGQLVVLYPRPLPLARILADVAVVKEQMRPDRPTGEPLLGGPWLSRGGRDFLALADVCGRIGRPDLAEHFAGVARERRAMRAQKAGGPR